MVPPEDAYLKRTDDRSAIVGCYETRQTWQLSCHGNRWTGTVGVCNSRSQQQQHGDAFSGSAPLIHHLFLRAVYSYKRRFLI